MPAVDLNMEPCRLGKEDVLVPRDLIEKPEVFQDVLSLETWNSVLSAEQRQHLSKFLPTFPENSAQHNEETLRSLFSGENFKFGNPLQSFQKQLKGGYLFPANARLKAKCQKAKFRDYKFRQQRYYQKLLKDVIISRERVLQSALQNGPDYRVPPPPHPDQQGRPCTDPVQQRASRTYHKILQEVKEECGVDDNTSSDEEGEAPQEASSLLSQQVSMLFGDSPPSTPRVVSTMAPRPKGTDLGASGASTVAQPPPPAPPPPPTPTDQDITKMLLRHKRRRTEQEDAPELDTQGMSLNEVILRTNRRPTLPRQLMPSFSPPVVKKKEKKDRPRKKPKAEPKVEEDPSSLGAANTGGVTSTQTGVLTGKLKSVGGMYVSFFVLLKSILQRSAEQTLSIRQLEEYVRDWQSAPTSLLNAWYSTHRDWSQLVLPALRLLAGKSNALPPSFSPCVEYRNGTQDWKWIGQASDSDLTLLCKQWLQGLGLNQKQETEGKQSSPVPPPRMRTDYVVRPSNGQEKEEFRKQEEARYQGPHKPFTYRMHGYEAVVGPVKGVKGKETTFNKAREHSLLVPDRPACVTILSLVRDAAARLPNGEGTRAEICELLKDSSYLAKDATDSQINAVVSGALDRLHYEKDPCVKYDPIRKVWIYLHRNRTEEDFMRIHEVEMEAARQKKAAQQKQKAAKKSKQPAIVSSTAMTTSVTATSATVTAPAKTAVSSELTRCKSAPSTPSPKPPVLPPGFQSISPIPTSLTSSQPSSQPSSSPTSSLPTPAALKPTLPPSPLAQEPAKKSAPQPKPRVSLDLQVPRLKVAQPVQLKVAEPPRAPLTHRPSTKPGLRLVMPPQGLQAAESVLSPPVTGTSAVITKPPRSVLKTPPSSMVGSTGTSPPVVTSVIVTSGKQQIQIPVVQHVQQPQVISPPPMQSPIRASPTVSSAGPSPTAPMVQSPTAQGLKIGAAGAGLTISPEGIGMIPSTSGAANIDVKKAGVTSPTTQILTIPLTQPIQLSQLSPGLLKGAAITTPTILRGTLPTASLAGLGKSIVLTKMPVGTKIGPIVTGKPLSFITQPFQIQGQSQLPGFATVIGQVPGLSVQGAGHGPGTAASGQAPAASAAGQPQPATPTTTPAAVLQQAQNIGAAGQTQQIQTQSPSASGQPSALPTPTIQAQTLASLGQPRTGAQQPAVSITGHPFSRATPTFLPSAVAQSLGIITTLPPNLVMTKSVTTTHLTPAKGVLTGVAVSAVPGATRPAVSGATMTAVSGAAPTSAALRSPVATTVLRAQPATVATARSQAQQKLQEKILSQLKASQSHDQSEKK
ncbi:PREDICTED: nuclear factor related to kappa-B-binding protein-like [Branchiostoma belcheri]|uniref:Nuclear factor related to kappa-B-binding protein-like n=1 Tax=Branchiostoma belcheri TaxID=7741 RepID=A0A6P5A0K5_BRABE|nr:PREDICTED: nuclear factor related to kappa-B-binding protein-like [Branchiostoma belcheri]XP_019636722.1 PREDICTED: nuclear factor related to kappa-B-binding protein-like [Branchiostoma belcheri]